MYLIVLIIVSLVFYVYLKVQQVKAKGPMGSRWYSAKGSIAIGVFFISAGISAYLTFGTNISAFVSIFFALFGMTNILLGFRNYRLYLPYARKEVEEINKLQTTKNG